MSHRHMPWPSAPGLTRTRPMEARPPYAPAKETEAAGPSLNTNRLPSPNSAPITGT